MNYYELLEISPSASVEVIRNAYKTLAKKYHPDTYKGDVAFAEEKMKLLNEAVSVLENEYKRKEYNKINGINPMSNSGYSDYGRNNMINVDENGEPIFFSYDLGGLDDSDGYNTDEQSGDDELSYMDVIDDFLNNSKTEKKSKPPKKSMKSTNIKKKEVTVDDFIDDISEIDVEKSAKSEMEFNYDNLYVSNDVENIEDFKTYNLRGKSRAKSKAKSLSNKNRLYYVVLASLIAADIFIGILVGQSVDWDNIKEIMSGVSGNPNGEEDSVGNFGGDDYTNEDGQDFVFEENNYTPSDEPTRQTAEPVTEPTIEDISEEETTAPVITAPAAITSTNKNTVIMPTVPPATSPPATTRAQTTNPPATTATEAATTTEPVVEKTEEATEPDTTEIPAITVGPMTEDITDITKEMPVDETEAISETEPSESMVEPESDSAAGSEEAETSFEYNFDYDYLITEQE